MEQNKIRLLRTDEIECRIGTISENGLSLLLYTNARACMDILDQVFGLGWKRQHVLIGGNLYCIVSIWDEDRKQWIDRMDVGTESYTEREKGAASDSFKRACVSVGIGRELYSAPFIWIPASKTDIQSRGEGNNRKYYTYDKFTVQSIAYNDKREITGLTIINQDGAVIYSLTEKGSGGQKAKAQKAADKTKTAAVGKEKEAGNDYAGAINKELERTGVALDAVLERYGVSSIAEMSEDTYKKAITGLKRTKSKAA